MDTAVSSPAPDEGLAQFQLVGASPAFRAATAVLKRLAGCGVPVLLRGETGTGKELAARAIHYLSDRRELPFIPVNCGAIPDMLVESELFGHARGAFTDAREAQPGLVVQAGKGTLFLDEVDALSMKAQITLLRFLQDGSFRPLGAKAFANSQARIVAATNADIAGLVRSGAFRSDLFYRLSIVPVFMPPLRERAGDVRLLVDNFLRVLARQHGGGPRRIDEASLRRLEAYAWPGNVRELANVVQRLFLLADGDSLVLAADALGAPEGAAEAASMGAVAMVESFQLARAQALAEFECRFVRRALSESAGNVSLAARRSGKERRSFGRLLKKHGIDRVDFGSAN
ncbi:MAG: sigma-54-dependent Fis family transcriptional regulator [Bacteriovorax sp.]|nr:sigma-54-dependent Fis family transcriptional regulator [Rhizobacter sp.]